MALLYTCVFSLSKAFALMMYGLSCHVINVVLCFIERAKRKKTYMRNIAYNDIVFFSFGPCNKVLNFALFWSVAQVNNHLEFQPNNHLEGKRQLKRTTLQLHPRCWALHRRCHETGE